MFEGKSTFEESSRFETRDVFAVSPFDNIVTASTQPNLKHTA